MSAHHDVLVVGAGPAGTQVAVGLATAGFTGSIGVLGSEPGLPYERPPLSKAYLMGEVAEDALPLRPAAYWIKSPIELHSSTTVERLDVASRTVGTTDGREFTYGSLVWAAGCRPRVLPVPGAGLSGVLALRTLDDARQLRGRLGPDCRVVVVGGGYIGLEVAASATKLGASVTVLEAQERVLARVAGAELATFVTDQHRAAGVRIELNATVTGIVGDGERCTGVRLANGGILPADVVVVGIGVVPNVEPVAAAGADAPDGLLVDLDGCTTLPDVLAVGDCALVGTDGLRLESIPNAAAHAKAVVATLTGAPRPGVEVPWFWSNQYELRLKTAGILVGHDATVVRGDPATGRFAVVYLAGDVVVAVDTVNSPKDFAQAKLLIGTEVRGKADVLADPTVALKDLAREAAAV